MITLATWLTILRIAALLPIVIGVLAGWYWFALIWFAISAITDFFDGWVARKYNQVTPLGTMLDPIADKLLVAVVPLALAGAGVLTPLGILAATAIICREFLVAGLREYLGNKTIKLPVTMLAKWKTTVQLFSLGIIILLQAVYAAALWQYVGEATLVVAAVITWVTGWQYWLAAKPHFAAEPTTIAE